MLRPLAAGLFACVLCTLAPATTLSPRTTAGVIDLSERVCCARCDAVEARLDPRTGIVFTYVRLTLLEDMKGEGASNTILLRIVGGKASGVETVVPGMPRFSAGGESILMLGRPNRLGYPVVVEARRGVLGVTRDEDGARFVRGPLTGLPECEDDARVPLDAFRSAVRRCVHDQRARAAGEEAK